MARTVYDPVSQKNVLAGGDPSYQDVATVGSATPQNEVLDPVDTTKSVAQLVLEYFDITFSTPVLGGNLPGLDIKNQDPTTMLKLSLAAELLDTPPPGSQRSGGLVAGFAEVELDPQGIARFYMAGQTQAVGLDIRYCVPTANIVNPANMVIVRGYDPPPRRELRPLFNGLKNAEIMDYSDCAENSCDENTVAKYVTISYDDPQLDQTYLDDIVNSYELQAFESLLGYLIDLDLPDGTNEETLGTKITFGDTTKEYIKYPSTMLNDATQSVNGGRGKNGAYHSLESYTKSSITSSDQFEDPNCTSPVDVVGTKITIPASRFMRLNKFGREESDFNGVVDIVFAGRKVTSISTQFVPTKVFVKPSTELITLQKGKNWNWETNADEDVIIEIFSKLEDSFSAFICELYQNNFNYGPGSPAVVFSPSNSVLDADILTEASVDDLVCNVGDSLGYLTGGSFCVVIERKRPSVDIFDPLGDAITTALAIVSPGTGPGPDNYEGFQGSGDLTGLNYTPVVIIDEPSPIAYASVSTLSSDDGTRTLAAEGIIDQADGIVDADPTTTQDIEDSELSILQDNTTGATIDMTMPFAYGVDATGRAGTECLEIARNFLALQSRVTESTSVILGPDSTPQLGDVLPDGSVINEINWSYSDSSQYLITATAGPLYLTSGSFNDSRYQLQTEDVTREGIVIQDVGDGTTYIVRVEGFGEITALLMVMEDLAVGDKVQVRLYNNPVERLN